MSLTPCSLVLDQGTAAFLPYLNSLMILCMLLSTENTMQLFL